MPFFKTLQFKAAMVSLLILFTILGIWEVATTGTCATVSSGSASSDNCPEATSARKKGQGLPAETGVELSCAMVNPSGVRMDNHFGIKAGNVSG